MGALLGKVLNYHTNAYYDCLEEFEAAFDPPLCRLDSK